MDLRLSPGSLPCLNPKALRTHILRFLGPATILRRAFRLWANYGELKRGHPEFNHYRWENTRTGLDSGFCFITICHADKDYMTLERFMIPKPSWDPKTIWFMWLSR